MSRSKPPEAADTTGPAEAGSTAEPVGHDHQEDLPDRADGRHMRPSSVAGGPRTPGDRGSPAPTYVERQRDDVPARGQAPPVVVRAYAGFALVLIVVSIFATPLAQGVIVAIAGAVGGGATVSATRRNRPRKPLPWLLLGVGTMLIALPRSMEQLTLNELVPAETGERVAPAQALREASGNVLDHRVAHRVAQTGVDLLQVVEIDQGEGHLPPGAIGLRHRHP